MRSDVISRLAAANPVPVVAERRAPFRARRAVLALAAAVVVAIPAVAFGGRLADVLGISNGGTAVPTGDVLPGESQLDQALQQMDVGSTMQLLGTQNGVRFYAARNADGNFCIATERVDAPYPKGVFCDLNADNFPSADVKALSYPRMLTGVAADGVATVELVAADGTVLDSAPVRENLFASGNGRAPDAAYLEALDANGNVLSKQKLP